MTSLCIKQGYNRPLFYIEPYRDAVIWQNDVSAVKKLCDYIDIILCLGSTRPKRDAVDAYKPRDYIILSISSEYYNKNWIDFI